MKQIDINSADLIGLLYEQSEGKINNCSIEIINYCPFKCDFCYIPKDSRNHLPYKKIKKILDELLKLDCLSILFTGGEILLHPEFKKIYLYAWNKGFRIGLNTNGYLFNEEWLEFFDEYKPKTIEISIYGYNNKTYHQFTHVKDSFPKVEKTLNLLKNCDIKTTLKSLLTKQNYSYFDKLVKYAKSKGLLFRWDFVVFPVINNSHHSCNDFRVEADRAVDILFSYHDIKKYFATKVFEMGTPLLSNNKVFQCSGGKDSIHIDAKGNIRMCLCVPNKELNINNNTITESLIYFENFKRMPFSKESKCKDCYKKGVCRYCPGRFYLETGDYNCNVEWYCDIANGIIRKVRKKTLKGLYLDNLKKRQKLVQAMYKIIINNIKKTNVDFNEKEDDYKKWFHNITTNKDLRTIVLLDRTKVCAYLQYIILGDNYFICEIQVDDIYQGDGITFRKLIGEFIKNSRISANASVLGNINPNNLKSITVFSKMGFKRTNKNNYHIGGNKLLEWFYGKKL